MSSDPVSDLDDTESPRGGIIATHLAHPGTFIVFASKGKVVERHPVILWGVNEDGLAVPMTMNGTWDDIADSNSFVLFPTGDCSRYERNWPNLEHAVGDILFAE